ncbi:MAG: DUF2480 family protein [Bacteroidetes bacterium]|nr:DUF2480 family protein [Bacteroidota bacterium]MBS1933552.1 DUF2480 family protein [Bacteroidota bacterium]
MSEEIINKVAQSQLLTLNLEEYFPKEEIVVFDLKPFLFMELILKEKDFREALQNTNWQHYQDKIVAVTCSADAIIPVWAYMLIATYLEPYAKDIIMGNEKKAAEQILLKNIQQINIEGYTDKRVVVKGCSDLPIGEVAYMEITKRLRPLVKSIMYGEPCSTVPVYKRK